MKCPTCSHPVSDHSNLAGGCLFSGGDTIACRCAETRRSAQAKADAAATEVALERVEAAADPAWVTQAEDAVATLAAKREAFTTDDVWDLLESRGVASPREPRALGPIMKRLGGSAGVIRLEGYASSRRRHGSVIRSYVGAR